MLQDDKINGTVTLECANKHDDIATQPVVDVIRESHPSLLWLASVVASFILLSITLVCPWVADGVDSVEFFLSR